MFLSNIRIVLVRPTHRAMSAARARHENMSLHHLYLVAPEDFPSADAHRPPARRECARKCVICASLDEALKDCHLVIGTSARQRRIEWPSLDPESCAPSGGRGAAGPGSIAFGQERTGLLNAELDDATFVVTIPTDRNYSSLNLACAVQILAYEIHRVGPLSRQRTRRIRLKADRRATRTCRGLYRHMEEVLQLIGF
jgi:TrmH family RNA methyltransferase